MEEINVNWEGPFKIEDIVEDNIDKLNCDVCSDDIGLYQIYGSHPLYGSDVLVYIGRTKNKKGFKSRLKNRWVIEGGNDSKNVQIYLGTLFNDTGKIENENEKIDKAEVLMINALKPAFNSSNIQSVSDSLINKNYLVKNYGNYRSLFPILHSEYYWKSYKNFSFVDKMAGIYKKTEELESDDTLEGYYGFSIEINDKFNIWLGIDYPIWDNTKHKIPLVLEVYSEDENGMNSFELEDLEFSKFEYENGSLSYYPLSFEMGKDKIDNLIKSVNDKLNKTP